MTRPPIKTMFLNAITTADDQAIDPIRLGMVVSGLSIIFLAGYDVIFNKNAPNFLELGGGLALVFGGGGFGLAAKSRDETAIQLPADEIV
jgi:hypothetical protein